MWIVGVGIIGFVNYVAIETLNYTTVSNTVINKTLNFKIAFSSLVSGKQISVTICCTKIVELKAIAIALLWALHLVSRISWCGMFTIQSCNCLDRKLDYRKIGKDEYHTRDMTNEFFKIVPIRRMTALKDCLCHRPKITMDGRCGWELSCSHLYISCIFFRLQQVPAEELFLLCEAAYLQ